MEKSGNFDCGNFPVADSSAKGLFMSTGAMRVASKTTGQGAAARPAYMPDKTRWSVLEEARAGSQAARDEFFHIYWPPVYAYFRAKGLQEADAKDRTQNFFLKWIKYDTLSTLDKERGPFTNFLLFCLKNHNNTEFLRLNRQRSQPAGGTVSWDEIFNLDCSHFEPVANQSPDAAFELVYKRRLILTAFKKVSDGGAKGGPLKQKICQLFYRRYVEPMLDDGPSPSLEALAEEFGLTMKKVRVRLKEMLELFRKQLVAELVPEVGLAVQAEKQAREILLGYS